MRISDWSSDVCSSDLTRIRRGKKNGVFAAQQGPGIENAFPGVAQAFSENVPLLVIPAGYSLKRQYHRPTFRAEERSEERRVGNGCVSTCRSLCSLYH